MAAKRKTKTEAAAPASVETVTAYKGFDANWQCRGFQYAIGQTYTMDGEIVACRRGFHACEHPLNVFDYYSPAGSRFAEVTLSGAMSREDGGDTKIAAASITVKVELSISDLVQRAWDWVWSRATVEEGGHATGYQGAASATGYQGAASATGDRGAASATGHRGAASATGYQGAASATGDRGAASATGDQGAASATGDQGAAMACGIEGCAMGKDGCALFLTERVNDFGPDHGKIVAVWAGIVGEDGVQPDTWYMLKGGKPVEVA